MQSMEELTYRFQSKPFGLRIHQQQHGGPTGTRVWQVIDVSNPDLIGRLHPGSTVLVGINGSPPPDRFDQLAQFLMDTNLPVTMTFRTWEADTFTEISMYSSSEDTTSILSNFSPRVIFGDHKGGLKSPMNKFRDKDYSLRSGRGSKKDRFLRQLEMRDQRREKKGFVWSGQSKDPEDGKLDKMERKIWEYEDVTEIMRMGGVQKALVELENLYSRRIKKYAKADGDFDNSKPLLITGWHYRATATFGKIGHFMVRPQQAMMPPKLNIKRAESPSDEKRQLVLRQRAVKYMRTPVENKKHKRTVTFSDWAGKSLFIGPRVKSHSDVKRSKCRSALKRAQRESYTNFFKRMFEESRLQKQSFLEQLKKGAVLLKFDSQGRPAKRWFCVSSDGTELYYTRRKPQAMIRKHAKDRYEDSLSTLKKQGLASVSLSGVRSVSISISRSRNETVIEQQQQHKSEPEKDEKECKENEIVLPAVDKEHDMALKQKGLSGLFKSSIRRYMCADIVEQYLGPWVSGLRDKQIVPWRFFTLKFPDRVLNLQCSDEQQMDVWYLGLQALAPTAPMNPLYLSKGRYLWKRLIMKLEYYGIEAIRQIAVDSEYTPSHSPAVIRHKAGGGGIF